MKKLFNQIGTIHILPLLVIVAAVGLISYLLISSAAPFKGGLFETLNPQPKSQAATAGITVPLKASTINSHYFVDGNGKAVYLSGSHTFNDLQDLSQSSTPAAFDFNAYVNFLKAHGQNMTILWKKDLPTYCSWGAGGTWHIAQFPWMRMGPGTATDGKPKFDLSMFDQTYFDRLRSRVIQLQQNNIYTAIELFDGLQLVNNRCSNDGYPFTGANNVNGVDDGGGVGSMTMTTANGITNFEDAYVKKVIDTLKDQPNVIWEISEEAPSGSDTWWSGHMIDLIHTYESSNSGLGYMQHPVLYPSTNAGDLGIFSSHADAVAPGSKFSSSNNQGKVIINDSDHSFYDGPGWTATNQQWHNYLWQNFVAGASVIFMDPYTISWPSRNACQNPVNGVCTSEDPRWNNFRDNMGAAVAYGNKMNLLSMHTQGNLSSTTNVLANPAATGSEFLVYAPNGGSFTVNLSNTTRVLNVEWYNPTSNAFITSSPVTGGSSSQSFTPPFGGDAVLYLVDSGGAGTPPPTPTPTPTPAPGTPALVQSNTLDSTGTSVTVAYNNNVSGGNLLVTAIRIGNKTALGNVTDNDGNTWTLVNRQADNGSGNGDTLELWYAANAKITPNLKPTLTITSSVSASIRAVVEEYSNIATTNPLDQNSTTIGNSGMSMATSGATTQANEVAIGYGELENGSVFTADSSYALDQTVATKLATEYRILTSTGVQSPMFTVASQNWAMGIATFKAMASGSTSSPTPSPTPTPTVSPTPTPSPSPNTCPKGPLGDIDCDGQIGIFDYNIIVTHFGQSGTNIPGDINNNGQVEIFDYNILVTNFGG